MRKILLPVDGSEQSYRAAQYVVNFSRTHGPVEVHVLNVEPAPVELPSAREHNEAINAHLASRAHLAMKSVLHLFAEAQVGHHEHVRLGNVAETIIKVAGENGCDTIVMGTRGLGAVVGLALGSVTRKVLHLTDLPVVCIK